MYPINNVFSFISLTTYLHFFQISKYSYVYIIYFLDVGVNVFLVNVSKVCKTSYFGAAWPLGIGPLNK